MLCTEALDKFLEYEKIIGSVVPTQNYYSQNITYFINHIGNKDIKKLSIDDYNDYVLYLREKNVVNNNKEKNKKLSPDTIRTRTTAVKAFFNYLYNNNLVTNDITVGLPSFSYGKKVINVLSKSQIEEIMNYYKADNFLGARNLLILSLFLDCGLRLSEVTRLYVQDFNLELNIIKVLGKGNKERFVPLSPSVKKYFLAYRSFYTLKKGKLLVDNKFRSVTNSCISRIFRTLKADLGYEELHPHHLRHTFATLFLVNGGDPISLQLILGHSTLTMTEKYVHIAEQLVISSKSKFSPLSNI